MPNDKQKLFMVCTLLVKNGFSGQTIFLTWTTKYKSFSMQNRLSWATLLFLCHRDRQGRWLIFIHVSLFWIVPPHILAKTLTWRTDLLSNVVLIIVESSCRTIWSFCSASDYRCDVFTCKKTYSMYVHNLFCDMCMMNTALNNDTTLLLPL